MSKLTHVLILVFTMAVVTYLIRLIPFILFKRKIKSRFIKSLLYYIPYAVLTAMTFPSIFFVTGNVYTALFGTVVALVASLTKRSLVTVAILAVIAVLISNFIILI